MIKKFIDIVGPSPFVLYFCLLLAATNSVFAQSISSPKRLWISLSSSPLQLQPCGKQWLRAQENGQLIQTISPIEKSLAGIVVPVFDKGHAYYISQVAPFAGRNSSAKADEKALYSLLSTAKAHKIPVYLSIDVLAWQKDELDDESPKGGIFGEHPNWREIRKPGTRPQTPEAFFASPWHPEVRDALQQLLSEIGKKFSYATGVILNLRLSAREVLGFSDVARLSSIRALGLDPLDLNLQNRADDEDNSLVKQWRAWKLSQMSALIKDLRVAYTRGHPRRRVLVWGVTDYPERGDFNGLRSSQDWKSWVQTKLADGVLLDGRWTSHYSDTSNLAFFVSQRDLGEKLIAVSQGTALFKGSSFARDWSALAIRENIKDMVFTVRSNTDLQAIVRLASGKEKLALPPMPAVGESFPNISVLSDDGKSWQPSDVRGKTALALLLNPTALLMVSNLTFTANTTNLQLVEVVGNTVGDAKSLRKSLGTHNTSTLLKDTRRDLLSYYDKKTRLVIVDRAGWVRRSVVLSSEIELRELLTHIDDPTPTLAVGQPAPDFTIFDANGQSKRLNDLKDKSNLVLTFFPKCFTGGCANHLTSLQNEISKFQNSNTIIWAVSTDPPDEQISFAKSLNISFPILSDTGRQLSFLYRTVNSIKDFSARRSILIDKKGIVRYVDTNISLHAHGIDMLDKIHSFGLDSDRR